jgi:hypothetical protein
MSVTQIPTEATQTNAVRPERQRVDPGDFWRNFAIRSKKYVLTPKQRFSSQLSPDHTGLAQPTDSRTVDAGRQVLALPPPSFRFQRWEENFITLARWEGRVLEVTESSLIAALIDELDHESPEEEARIPIDEISPADLELVKPGALFYWSIGYRLSGSGQRFRESVIRFRRLPRWSIEEIEHARRRVESSPLRFERAESTQKSGPS